MQLPDTRIFLAESICVEKCQDLSHFANFLTCGLYEALPLGLDPTFLLCLVANSKVAYAVVNAIGDLSCWLGATEFLLQVLLSSLSLVYYRNTATPIQ